MSQVSVHPNYRVNSNGIINFDLALLKLNGVAECSSRIRPICLPDNDYRYKPSVLSSFDPPKVEKRWRYYHTFYCFGPLKKSVMGSIPGAAPVLIFVSPTVLGGTIIKIDVFLRGFLAIKHDNLGDCKN